MLNLEELLSSINEGVWSVDQSKNKLLFVNQQLADICGKPYHEVKNNIKTFLNLIHPEDAALFESKTSLLKKELKVETEHRIVTPDAVKWVIHKQMLLPDSTGQPNILVSLVTDITQKKETERKLAERESIFNYLFRHNPNPLWIFDYETLKFLAVNDAAIAQYGYREEEFLSMTILDIRPKEDIPGVIRNIGKNPLELGYSKRWRHIKKDKNIVHVNITGHEILYRERKAKMVLAHDITNEVKSQQETLIAKNNLDAVINNINDLIWSVDKNYCIISANKAFSIYYKLIFNKDLGIGDSVFKDEKEDTVKAYWKKYYDQALAGEAFVELINTKVRNTPLTIEIRYNPIYDENNEIIGVGCFSRDITEWIETKEELLNQNTRLKEIASLASHDIRGPVTSLMGLVNLFNRKNLSDPFNENLIDCIQIATLKLDGVIHKIVEKTGDVGEHPSFTPVNYVQYSRSVNE